MRLSVDGVSWLACALIQDVHVAHHIMYICVYMHHFITLWSGLLYFYRYHRKFAFIDVTLVLSFYTYKYKTMFFCYRYVYLNMSVCALIFLVLK